MRSQPARHGRAHRRLRRGRCHRGCT